MSEQKAANSSAPGIRGSSNQEGYRSPGEASGVGNEPVTGADSPDRSAAYDPNGPGTPGGRMHAVWDWIHEEGAGREKVLEELCPGWSPVSSKITSEQALMVAFDALVAERNARVNATSSGSEVEGGHALRNASAQAPEAQGPTLLKKDPGASDPD